MSKNLPIGSGIARARKNRHRPRRSTDVSCSECSQPIAQVADCTCLITRRGPRPLVLRKTSVKQGGRS